MCVCRLKNFVNAYDIYICTNTYRHTHKQTNTHTNKQTHTHTQHNTYTPVVAPSQLSQTFSSHSLVVQGQSTVPSAYPPYHCQLGHHY